MKVINHAWFKLEEKATKVKKLKTWMRVKDFYFSRKICRILNKAGGGVRGVCQPLSWGALHSLADSKQSL